MVGLMPTPLPSGSLLLRLPQHFRMHHSVTSPCPIFRFCSYLAFGGFHHNPLKTGCFLRAEQCLHHLSQDLHVPSSPHQATQRDITRIWEQVSAHLSHCEDEVHGRVLRVDAFQLHAQSEAILIMSDRLVLSTHRLERTQPPSSLSLA